MNKLKYMIPLFALILLVPVGTSNTFAQSGPGEGDFTENIGPVGVVEEYTAESHKLRIDAKKQNIKVLEEKITIIHERIFELEATFADLNSKGITGGQENVKTSLDALYVKLNILQEEAYTLFEIPEERYQKLSEVKKDIFEAYENSAMINDVFIDHLDESVQVILHSNYFELHKSNVLDTTDSIALDKFEDVTGEINVEVKHFTESTVTGADLYCAEFEHSANNRNMQCSQGTIAFPATKGSDNGFVTVGHAFGDLLSGTTAGTPTYQAKVYQPGPDSGNVDGSAKVPTGQSLSDRVWQAQVIGKLMYGIYNDTNSNDAVFVKLLPGKTVDRKVIHYGSDYDIAGYNTGNPTVGHYVYKTGAATGTTFGFIRSVNTDNVYASYQQCRGDSGSPVGTVSRGEFTVYGMHLGLADDSPFFDQPPCESRGDRYSKFITYDKISGLLGITGQH